MSVRARMIGMMLCGATMLAHHASAQVVKGAKPRGQAPMPASNEPRRALKINLGPPRTIPRVLNPHAGLHDAAIIAVLQRQRQTADTQFAQMKTVQRTAAVPVTQPPQLPRGQVQPHPEVLSKAGTSLVAGPTKPGQTSGSQSVKPTIAPFLQSVVVACAMSGPDAMSIGQISGESAPATFTPIEEYNLYTITGCSFGPFDADKNRVYIFGKGSFQGNFQVRLWNENSITVVLDPALSGFLDQDNLTLVVQRADGKQASKGGFKFYAARGDANDNPIPLKQIPADYALLWPSDKGYFVTEYSAAADAQQGISAQVSRNLIAHKDATDGNVHLDNQNEKAVPALEVLDDLDQGMAATDEFDLRKLQQSFVAVSLDGFYWSPDPRSLCGAWDEKNHWTVLVSNWDFSWPAATRIMVHSQTTECRDIEAFGRKNWALQSQYALRVWVNGPRCIDPWTGQPDQKCISDVRAAKSNLNKP